jgi:hypothetical protein
MFHMRFIDWGVRRNQTQGNYEVNGNDCSPHSDNA